MTYYPILGLARRAGCITSGFTNCFQAVLNNVARLVIIAEDAGFVNKRKLEKACLEHNIVFVEVGSKKDFYTYLGKNSCYWAILDSNFAKVFLSKLGDLRR